MPHLWANQIKYLGIYVLGGKYFKVDTSTMRRNFFASVNGILSKCPRDSDITKLFLSGTHCLPGISYADESLNLLPSQYKEIISWWNSVYRNIFNHNKWDSVSEIIFYIKRLDYKSLCNIKKCNFRKRLKSNVDVNCCYFQFCQILHKFYIKSKEFFNFACKTGLDINISGSEIKFTMHKTLKQTFCLVAYNAVLSIDDILL